MYSIQICFRNENIACTYPYPTQQIVPSFMFLFGFQKKILSILMSILYIIISALHLYITYIYRCFINIFMQYNYMHACLFLILYIYIYNNNPQSSIILSISTSIMLLHIYLSHTLYITVLL